MSLFWRTFLLILLLLVASLLAWLQSFRVFEREPRAEQIAQQVVSIITLTRSALVHAEPRLRPSLLFDMARTEGVRVVPLEGTEQVEPEPDTPLARLVAEQLRARLGPATRLSGAVNGEPGIWVSFDLAGDPYWLLLERDPLVRPTGTLWLRWALVALLLSLAAAAVISRVLNRPLGRLSEAARALGAGETPAPLPEAGPEEIRTVNRSFNRMVGDLDKLAQDRAVLLAGISHDLRTPLTRLRLEIELNALPPAAREAMSADIDQIDAIVGQFLDYARATPDRRTRAGETIDCGALVAERLRAARLGEQRDCSLEAHLPGELFVAGDRTELARAIDNLITNASRYGRDAQGHLHLRIDLGRDGAMACLTVEDRGAGIPAAERARVLRPFERGESARTGSAGAGLGLPIVDRIARMHGGSLRLHDAEPHGLRVELRVPAVEPDRVAA